jgi:hypothetical protein
VKSWVKMARIFISYRRDDSAGYAGRVYDRLCARFGPEQVFMDLDDIKPGDDFVKVLDETEKNCAALVVVIGRSWLTVRSSDGTLRLFDPKDFVRQEIAAGLKNNVRLFPVLVGGSRMPQLPELPEDLASLAHVQALPIHDDSFQRNADQLIAVLEQVVSLSVPVAHFEGTWRSTIKYSWGDTHQEIFQFETDESDLLGTATYLGVPRVIQDGKINGGKIAFLTKSRTMMGDNTYEEKHQYSGKLVNGQINFRLLTETGYDSRLPEIFTAVADPAKI